ncbi:MAG: glycosyltransferase, partial [Anaerolineae bacterium]|nr:glycosyltransferase [Anaerolineae bacterium]
MLPVRVFIGFDPCETVAYHVLAHSIMRRSSVPVSITPVDVRHLEGIYTRERDPKQSNEFSFSR